MDSTSNLVDLNGRIVPLEALQLGWALEDRGLRLSAVEYRHKPLDPTENAPIEIKLHVCNYDGSRPVLSEGEVEAIRRYKQHLLTFLMEPPKPERIRSAFGRSRSKAQNIR